MIQGYETINISYENLSEEEKNLELKFYTNNDNIIVLKIFNMLDDLVNKWQDVQSFVAGNIQSNLSELQLDEKLMWNIYIIFLLNIDVDKNLKNTIETNKFCCKKYIVNVEDLLNEESINTAITETIPLFSNFNFGNNEQVTSNDSIVKGKIIVNSNNSLLSNKFLTTNNIQNITTSEQLQEFITNLKGDYRNENQAN